MVNIPKITKIRLLITHIGGTMSPPLFANISVVEKARKANITKEATANKPGSHLGKRLVRKYPIPVMDIPRYIIDHPVHAIASPNMSESPPNSVLVIASETSPILKPTTIIINPASMEVFLVTFFVIIKAMGRVSNA